MGDAGGSRNVPSPPLHSTCDTPNASRAWRPNNTGSILAPLPSAPSLHRAPVSLPWRLGFPAASALLCPGREPSRGHRGAGGDIKPLLGAGLSPDWGAEMSPPGPCFMLPVLKEQWSSLVQRPLPFLPCFVPAWWPPLGVLSPPCPPPERSLSPCCEASPLARSPSAFRSSG